MGSGANGPKFETTRQGLVFKSRLRGTVGELFALEIRNRPFPPLIRAVILLLCLAGGFVFLPLFAVAALIAWGLYSELTAPKQEHITTRWTVSPTDPDWKSYFLQSCESPAETAFLEAMITAYDLQPEAGKLRGGGLTLDPQYGVPPYTPFPKYRLDFLANDWLDIEIDGAEYHSSEEAIASDRIRDEFMRARGWDVLRIPAKVVFRSPQEAVRRVRDRIATRIPGGTTSRTRSVPRPERESEDAPRPILALLPQARGLQAAGVPNPASVWTQNPVHQPFKFYISFRTPGFMLENYGDIERECSVERHFTMHVFNISYRLFKISQWIEGDESRRAAAELVKVGDDLLFQPVRTYPGLEKPLSEIKGQLDIEEIKSNLLDHVHIDQLLEIIDYHSLFLAEINQAMRRESGFLAYFEKEMIERDAADLFRRIMAHAPSEETHPHSSGIGGVSILSDVLDLSASAAAAIRLDEIRDSTGASFVDGATALRRGHQTSGAKPRFHDASSLH